MADVFQILNKINVNDHVEKKNGLTYLSWVWAWGEVKKHYPEASYKVYENADGWIYHTDGHTCWVKTGVTIEGIEHIECLPVMDYRNKSIPFEAVTSTDVNKAIQRSITKAIARHGLGLYLYAGEDLPEDDPDAQKKPAKKGQPSERVLGEEFGKEIEQTFIENGITPAFVLKLWGIDSFANMTETQMDHSMKNLDKIKKKEEESKK